MNFPKESGGRFARLLRTREAAEYLGISTQALRKLVLAGELRAIPGESLRAPWRFDLHDLDQWIEKNKVGYPKAAR